MPSMYEQNCSKKLLGITGGMVPKASASGFPLQVTSIVAGYGDFSGARTDTVYTPSCKLFAQTNNVPVAKHLLLSSNCLSGSPVAGAGYSPINMATSSSRAIISSALKASSSGHLQEPVPPLSLISAE